MKQIEMKLDDITEDSISALNSFLDSGIIPEGRTQPRLAMLYGRLKSRGMKNEKAEAWLDKDRQRKKEDYKRKILNQIKQGLEEMRNENGAAGHYEYVIVNIKERSDGKTMEIGIGDYDSVFEKAKWKKTILIEEIYNPEFFQEMFKKYRTFND